MNLLNLRQLTMRSATATCWTYRNSWAGAHWGPLAPRPNEQPDLPPGENLLPNSESLAAHGRVRGLPTETSPAWNPLCWAITPLWMTVRWLALGTSERLVKCRVEGWQGQGLTFPPSLFPSCCQLPGSPVSNRGLLTCAVGPAGVLGGTWHWMWPTATEMCPPRLSRFPGTFVGTTEPASPPLSSTSPTTTAATMPVEPSVAGLAPPGEAALCLEEVAPPASGTRKARVLYDYEAADSSELALLADEVGLGATRVAVEGWLPTPGKRVWER